MVGINIDDVTISESSGQAIFRVWLNGHFGTACQVSVSYQTANGTASAGQDYVSVSGSGQGGLQFGPFDNERYVAVPLINDSAVEGTENFFLNLSGASSVDCDPLVVNDTQGRANITDDDSSTPLISITDSLALEGFTNSFRVSLSSSPSGTVSVSYTTESGTATSGSDFTPRSGTLFLTTGNPVADINVSIVNDSLAEPDEQYRVRLFSAVNAQIGDDTGLGTIRDDDPDPQISIADAQIAEGNSGVADMAFVVTLTQASGKPISVAFATSPGTATSGIDYLSNSGVLSFAPGEVSKSVAVRIQGDVTIESDETFFVTLSSPTNVSLQRSQAIGTIRTDDVNQSPVARAGTPYSFPEGSSLQLNGSASSDPNGDPLTYAWYLNGSTSVFSTASQPTATWNQLKAAGINDDGVYSVRLVVSDGSGSDDDVASVSVTPAAPTANAGSDRIASTPGPITLIGTGSDPSPVDVANLSFRWEVKNSLGSTVGTSMSSTLLFTPTINGVFTATLTVTDPDGLSATDDATITVDLRSTISGYILTRDWQNHPVSWGGPGCNPSLTCSTVKRGVSLINNSTGSVVTNAYPERTSELHTGHFEFTDVAPGSYTLEAFSYTGAGAGLADHDERFDRDTRQVSVLGNDIHDVYLSIKSSSMHLETRFIDWTGAEILAQISGAATLFSGLSAFRFLLAGDLGAALGEFVPGISEIIVDFLAEAGSDPTVIRGQLTESLISGYSAFYKTWNPYNDNMVVVPKTNVTWTKNGPLGFLRRREASPDNQLYWTAHSPVSLVIEDPLGRRLGWDARDPNNIIRYRELPGDFDEQGEPATVAITSGAVFSNYKVIVYGTGDGTYRLEGEALRDYDVPLLNVSPRPVQSGQVDVFGITLPAHSGDTPPTIGDAIIQGTVFEDLIGNGVRDAGDGGAPDRIVFLDLVQNGTLDFGEPTTVTNASGHYEFTGLVPGTYTVAQVAQTGWQPTFPSWSATNQVVSVGSGDVASADFGNVRADYGDAPLPYPTTYSDNGARHVDTGPTLGTNRDSDDDGVTFGSIRVGQLGAMATVNVQNAPAGTRLDAWIDFNRDGTWGGPGEQIASGVGVVNGNNGLIFDVPSWAVDGTTFARFRLSTAGGLGVRGAALDGEVEDYAVTVTTPLASSGAFSVPQPISTTADSALSVFAADIDSDGDMDVVSASSNDDKIAWCENNGGQFSMCHTINTTADGVISVFAADVDGDGDIDVLSASLHDDKIAWYENDGTPASGAWIPHIINTMADYAISVFAADLDGDGDMDVLSASDLDNKIAWYENDGTLTSGTWADHTITTAALAARSVYAADVDGDGDMDVLSSSVDDDKIAWYENGGIPSSGEWIPHSISTNADGAIAVFAVDMDRDGDTDVLTASAADDTVAWYENNGTPGSSTWTPHTISTMADSVRSVFTADMDGDGDMDVLSASSFDNKIAWYKNDGNQNFTPLTISTTADAAHSVFAADVDGDGDLDVLSASAFDDKIAWYENLGFDFGDAPMPYPTTLVENGARHVVSGPRLGGSRDEDGQGAHSNDAAGDGLDDDGVTFGSIRIGQLGAMATVNVQNAPGGAKLDAWIDWNADGSWGGPGEQVASSVAVVNGNNTLSFDVPSWAVDGTTFARLRLSTAGRLGMRGLAADGEVEDYAVTVNPPLSASGVFGAARVVSTDVNYVRSVFAADMDQDGDIDVLSASSEDDMVAWHENVGGQAFVMHPIIVTADQAWSVVAADVNGDGHMDVVSASKDDDTLAWYENNGQQVFTPHIIHEREMFTSGVRSVFVADVDGDGDLDVLSASGRDDTISWYENVNQAFTPHVITTMSDSALSVFAADVDGDGDIDVLSASNADNRIAWYENDGMQGFATTHTITAEADQAASVFAADVDGDGDMDVLSASVNDDKIAWYENNGSQIFDYHPISTEADGAVSVFAADMDGDGDVDVLAASAFGNTSWYENNGSQNFTPRMIGTAGASWVFPADIDSDGDLDVVSADNTIAWYENLSRNGDINDDSRVDLIDLAILQQNFGVLSGAEREMGDLNGDSVVDRRDLVILAKNYGKTYLLPVSAAAPSAVVAQPADARAADAAIATYKGETLTLRARRRAVSLGTDQGMDRNSLVGTEPLKTNDARTLRAARSRRS